MTPSMAGKVKRLGLEMHRLNEILHLKNVALDAMHWVWCDGGCNGGVHRHHQQELTEEMVQKAEHNAKRLRSWYENSAFRESWALKSDEEKNQWFEDQRFQ